MPQEKLPVFKTNQKAISASEMNNLVAAVRDLQNQFDVLSRFRPGNKAIAHNKTGVKLERGNVVIMKAPVEPKAISQAETIFLRHLSYDVQKPKDVDGYTHDINSLGNTVGVVLGSAAVDGSVLVETYGPVQVKLDVQNDEHEWADVIGDDITQMKTGVTGSAYIMGKVEIDGNTWGQVILNAHKHAASYNPQTNLGTWDLQNQGTIDGEPATGVKFSIVTVDETYVAGSGETVHDVQYDAHGHLVLVDGAFNSSSSVSSDSTGAQNSSSSIPGESSESSESGAATNCQICDPDPVRWLVTITDAKFTYDGQDWDISGTYTCTWENGTATQCFYRSAIIPIDATYSKYVRIEIYNTNIQICEVGMTGGASAGYYEMTADNATATPCEDYNGTSTVTTTSNVTNVDANAAFSSDARF